MLKEQIIVVPVRVRGTRIDIFLAGADLDPKLSRSRIQDLIREGHITVNGKTVKPHHKLAGEETIRVLVPASRPLNVMPADIPVPVLYEDADLIVVDKPAGMVVHPGPGNPDGTLVNALLYHCRDLSGIGGVERPGIVHRLDKDTSGVMVAVKNDEAHRSLSSQIKARTVKKIYRAVVRGQIKEESGVIEAPIGRHERQRKKMSVKARRAREAVTAFRVLERFEGSALLELELKTGRTHQIRVHLAHVRHPVVGDPVYGGRGSQQIQRQGLAMVVKRQMLHSYILGFVHPRTRKPLEFTAPLPADMEEVLRFLKGGSV